MFVGDTSGAGERVVDHLEEVLGDDSPRATRGSGRFLSVEPSRVAESRRRVEQLIADPHLSDIATLSDSEISELEEPYVPHAISGH